MLPFLAGWIIYRRHRRGQRWLAANVVAAVAFIAVVSPWFVRNYEVFHRFIPFRDNIGIVLLMGTRGETSYWGPYELGPWHNDEQWNEFKQFGELGYMDKRSGKRSTSFGRILAGTCGHPFAVLSFCGQDTGVWIASISKKEPLDPPNIFFCIDAHRACAS